MLSQQHEQDSLYERIERMPLDSNKVDAYISFMEKNYAKDFDKTYEIAQKTLELSKEIDYGDGVGEAYGWLGFLESSFSNDSLAIDYYQKSLAISRKQNDIKLIKTNLNNLANIYSAKGDNEKAIKIFNEVIELHKKHGGVKGAGAAYLNLGHVYSMQGNLKKAFDCAFDGLSAFEKAKDTAGLAGAANMIGLMYRKNNDFNKAEKHFKRALEYAQTLNYPRIIARSLNNLGLVAKKNDQLDVAIDYFKESLDIREGIKDKSGRAESSYNLAISYKNKGDLDSSDYYFKISSRLDQETGDMLGLIQSEVGRGDIELRKGDTEKALGYYKKALDMAEKVDYVEQLKAIHSKLIRLYKDKGDYSKALESYAAYDSLKYKMLNQENNKAIARKEAQYEYEKKAVEDSLKSVQVEMELKQEKRIQRQKIQKQNIYILSGGIGIVLMGGLVLLLFKSNRIKQRSNDIINAQKDEVEFQKRVVEDKNLEIVDSIQYAKRLQKAIIPSEEVVKKYFENGFVFFQPKDIVSGDFYWFEHLTHPRNKDEQLIFFAAADCTGHGVPGAMVSLVCVNALNKAVREMQQTDPAKILDITRDIVIDTFSRTEGTVQDGMDISLGVLDTSDASLRWAGANNPIWIIKQSNDDIESYEKEILAKTKITKIQHSDHTLIEVKADKQPVGLFGDKSPFTSHRIHIEKGDQLYMFSDGYSDQFGGEDLPDGKQGGKKMKSMTFKKILLENSWKPMQEQKNVIIDAFENWKGDIEQLDDVCVIGVKI